MHDSWLGPLVENGRRDPALVGWVVFRLNAAVRPHVSRSLRRHDPDQVQRVTTLHGARRSLRCRRYLSPLTGPPSDEDRVRQPAAEVKRWERGDRKSVVKGKSVSVRGDLGGGRNM